MSIPTEYVRTFELASTLDWIVHDFTLPLQIWNLILVLLLVREKTAPNNQKKKSPISYRTRTNCKLWIGTLFNTIFNKHFNNIIQTESTLLRPKATIFPKQTLRWSQTPNFNNEKKKSSQLHFIIFRGSTTRPLERQEWNFCNRSQALRQHY